LRKEKGAVGPLVGMAVLDPVALAKGGTGSVRVMFCVKRVVMVATIVVSGPEEKLSTATASHLLKRCNVQYNGLSENF
jgi:hypothetical protein